MQLGLDLLGKPERGEEHRGPIQDDDGTGCDCCAQRLRCGVCGERYLGRLYAYYYAYDTADEDGYCIGRNGLFGDLPGPCCLPEDEELFERVLAEGYPDDELVRSGERVLGPWGVFVGRIWIPKTWPTGPKPWSQK